MPATKAERRHEQFRQCFVALLANAEIFRKSKGDADFIGDCEDLAAHAASVIEDDYEMRLHDGADDRDLANEPDLESDAPVLQEGAR